jgi:predicted DNA-binding protein (UPF0251 family)
MANRAGLRLVPQRVKTQIGLEGVREATTGRVLSLPQVWAVAASGSHETAPAEEAQAPRREVPAPQPELAFYRKYTEALLRRYLRTSMETGRVPSMMGREMFRGNVTSYKMKSFEDAVILCCDVERCLSRLTHDEQQLIKRIALQQYSQGEAACLLGISLRSCIRGYAAALDRVTAIFLKARLLEPLKSCQEAKA